MTQHSGIVLMKNVIRTYKMQWNDDINNDDIETITTSETIKI